MTGPLDPPVVPSYYTGGSLPRISNRRPPSVNSIMLARTNSLRHSWAVNKIPIKCQTSSNGGEHSPPSNVPSIAPFETLSMNNCQSNNSSTSGKYNTLTPSDAKRLTSYLGRRPPTRTASVLHKPRARPLLVTNLDDYGFQSTQTSTNREFSNKTNTNNPIFSQNTRSPNVSESNLSYRSSLDIVDSAYGSDGFQTTSIDLGRPSRSIYNAKDTFNRSQTKQPDVCYTPSSPDQSKSVKLESSLSSSTSRVFQNQLFNLRKFFRYLPSKRFGFNPNQKQPPSPSTNQGDDARTSNESIPQICLDRSLSPTVCPPPGELKSMPYIENTINYSNYDDFTRARNQQTATLLNSQRNQMAEDNFPRTEDMGLPTRDHEGLETWHLSLPLSYERNLTTVLEEKQNLTDPPQLPQRNPTDYYEKHLIEPPERFGNPTYGSMVTNNKVISTTNSSQSLASITTTDSVFDFHRQIASLSYEQVSLLSKHLLVQLWSPLLSS